VSRLLELDGTELEVDELPGDDARPPLVFLHEGLGCVALWRDVPARLAQATGRAAFVYSRAGYGQSSIVTEPRRADYLHREALDVLPALLDVLGIERVVLVGHSDGASIAIVFAAAHRRAVSGLVLLAPHVFVEEQSIAGIRDAKATFDTTDLPERMARYHRDASATFRGWNAVWLSPEFRSWNIEGCLPGIDVPVLVVQGSEDEYGTLRQVDAIEAGVRGPVERLVVDGCGHAPHVDRPDAVLPAVAAFIADLPDRPSA
jgi:pimeloyl-ACP methyl ester carboxylesterase